MKIGSKVLVISGKHKGKKSKVVSIKGDRVLVADVNLVTKHIKANPNKKLPAQILKKESPIHISNLRCLD